MDNKQPKHTPGQLHIDSFGQCAATLIGGSPPESVATVDASKTARGRANAARLVACWNAYLDINPDAVPELLAIVKAELDSGRNFGGDGNLYLRARDAIAKAEGGAA